MIERLLRKLGFVPESEVDRAYHEGRVDGQQDATEMYRVRLESIEARYSDIERHRDALMRCIARGVALQPPPPIIIEAGAAIDVDTIKKPGKIKERKQ